MGNSRDTINKIRAMLAAFLGGMLMTHCSCPAPGPGPEPAPPKAAMPAEGTVPLAKHFTREQGFAFLLPTLKPVAGVGGVKATDCANCHETIYREWRASTHAAALRDIQFQAEIYKPSSPRWLCLNCHIPLSDQRRTLVKGLTKGDVLRPKEQPNPAFDAALEQEAITCATCHVRPDKDGASQIIGPRGNPRAPHPTRKDRPFLRRVCFRCHDPRGERITPLLVCWFKTREEWKAGPYAEDQHCVDCHMPAADRHVADAFDQYPRRRSHQHHWVGGGVPKEFAAYGGLLKRGYESGLQIDLESWEHRAEGGEVALKLSFSNANAGHWLPTADPERHLLLRAELQDGKGQRLARASSRIGQTWQWHPRAEKKGDNRLKPGEERTWETSLKAPKGSSGLRLVLTAYHIRLTSKSARHMQQTKVPETFIKGIQQQVRQIHRGYPMATLIYQERVDLDSKVRTRASPPQLLELSRAEQHKPLSSRDY